MKTEAWSRPARLDQVRHELWDDLPETVEVAGDDVRLASALLRWYADIDHLGVLQFLMSDGVDELLVSGPGLIRTLATSSSRFQEITNEQLRGPVLWTETYSLRSASGNPALWVTAPARRDFQTAENRMFTAMLDEVVTLGTYMLDNVAGATASNAAPAWDVIRARVNEAEHLRQHRSLQEIERSTISARDIIRVKTGRARQRYEPVVAAYEEYATHVNRFEVEMVRDALERVGVDLATDATLMAVLTLLRMIDALPWAGWSARPLGFVQNAVQVRARSADNRKLTLHYREVPEAMRLGAKDFSRGMDQPEMVMRWLSSDGVDRWLTVACVLDETAHDGGASTAVERLRSYQQTFAPALAGQKATVGLGVVWGSGLDADLSADVTVCTPDRLPAAVETLLR